MAGLSRVDRLQSRLELRVPVDDTVFVYGSLMRGLWAHGELGAAVFEGQARTAPAYTLYDLGTYPGLCDEGHTVIHGELYRVDERTLARLDRFEDVPTLYRRVRLTTEDGCETWAYVLSQRPRPAAIRVVNGCWRRYLKDVRGEDSGGP